MSGNATAFVDRDLTCAHCGAEFVFSAGEQAFFATKGFNNDPKLCKKCHALSQGKTRVRFETRVVCTGSGVETTVPFKPRQGKPVFFRLCFLKSSK